MRGAAFRPACVRQGELSAVCHIVVYIVPWLPLTKSATLTHVPTEFARHTAAQVEKQCAKFFTMHVDQDTIDQGFIIAAHSPALSKFKLLLFEQAPDGHQWELVRQVRARPIVHIGTYALVCYPIAFGKYPSAMLTTSS